jgi:hypothetical protein
MIGKTMTPPRRQRKLCVFAHGRLVVVMAAALAAGAGDDLIWAATGERLVVDQHSGLAIGGFDPVGYFTEGAAVLGRGEFEYSFAGAVWRFRNAGNRAAFIADPPAYMPRLGGYDPVAIARGVAVPGHPRLWYLTGGRLYLFQTIDSRGLFVLDAERAIAAADRKWPSVSRSLVP